MKKRLINDVADLPKDFELSSYSSQEYFGIQDWCANLKLRALVRNIDSSIDKKWSADYVLRNPLLSENACAEFLSVALEGDIMRSQVFDLCTHDALEPHLYFSGERRPLKKYTDYFDDAYSETIDDEMCEKAWTTLLDTPYWKAKQACGITENSELVCAVVDLRMPEDQLVNQFRLWLRNIKFEKKTDVGRSSASTATLVDFAKYQVLAFMDLMYWAEVNHADITHHVLGLAIFPDDYQTALAERVRKVVGPLARRIVTPQYCDSMHIQVNALGKKADLKFLCDSKKIYKDSPEDAVKILFPLSLSGNGDEKI